MQLAALQLLVQVALPALPPPQGYVNDLAHILDSASIIRMDALIREVRDKTRGEIAVVTLGDLGGRAASEVAMRIGREWGVGAKAEAGDPAKNLGVVILLVPQRDHRPGTGELFIATGRGAEGFLPDARVGRIRDAMIPYLAREDYAGGLETGVDLVAQAFADQFGVTLTRSLPREPAPEPRQFVPGNWAFWIIVALWIILAVATRRRRRRWLWVGGGWGGRGGWSGGGGGGFGGGFGGFGGGGGFSGGGAGGRL